MTDKEAYYELDQMKTWSEDLSDDEIEALVFALRCIEENEKLTEELFKLQRKNADAIVYNAKLLQQVEDLKETNAKLTEAYFQAAGKLVDGVIQEHDKKIKEELQAEIDESLNYLGEVEYLAGLNTAMSIIDKHLGGIKS